MSKIVGDVPNIYCIGIFSDTGLEKIVFIQVAALEPSLNYLVTKFDNLVAKSTTDNIHNYHDRR